MITNKTRLNMVVGNPLTHSQSPVLHNLVYSRLNCNAVLLAHETDNLATSIEALKTLRTGLMAITMPFKSKIIEFLDETSAEVKKLNVANTVINRDGKLCGYNTDIDGIAFALRNVSLQNKTALILGAGGVSQPLAFFLKSHQVNLLWLNRSTDKAIAASKQWGGELVSHDNIQHAKIDLIINTTPLGMFPHINDSPLPNYNFNPDQTVFDMIYNPLETHLLKHARQQGATGISGMDMFIGQGLKQIELWLDQTIANDELIDHLRKTLQQSQQVSGELL